ncbi:MAG TPA: hypothetical protein VLC93_04230, partial [Myxococcota bacterium]|nr:hypothetical protein [Myxococcota bacterium]
MRATLGYIVSLAIGLSVNACSKSDKCELGEADSCDSGLACEAVEGGDAICVPETVVTGKVFDAETLEAIAGARVVVLDADTNAAASNVALTDAQGNFRARIQLRRSTEEGDDVKSGIYTLRVSATAYQEFPSPIRQAVPLTVTRADDKDELPDNTRDVALLALAGVDPATLGSISGRAHQGDDGIGGALIVAEGTGASYSAIADATGDFSVLNLAPGSYAVKGYLAGVAFTPVNAVTLASGEDKTGVDLVVDAAGQLFTLTGGIQIVNGQTSTTETLIVLALASTREVPAGLSAMTAGHVFTIAGIPPGSYDILASYNNDDLVI